MNNLKEIKTPVINALTKYYQKSPVSFHVPGHKKGAGCSQLQKTFFNRNIFDIDATEIPSLDNLNAPKGVISQSQALAAKLYGSKEAYFLVNGSSSGIHAMVMSSCCPGDKIIISRDTHRSVIAGIILSGAIPVYVEPQIDEKFRIPMGVSVHAIDKALRDNPNVACVLLPNPNYYGITTDLKAISKVVHSYGKALLVDEACGYHLSFSPEFPPSAVEAGADMCVQSVHKMGTSLTQTSLLHIITDRVHSRRVRDCLRIIGTSSPSYVLMASLDGARHHMEINKESIMDNMISNSCYLKSLLQKEEGIISTGYFIQKGDEKYAADITKTTISLRNYGLTGTQTGEILRTSYGIEVELEDLYNILIVVTHGNTRREIESLVEALKDIIEKKGCLGKLSYDINKSFSPDMPEMIMSPRKAMMGKAHKLVPLLESAGMICAGIICPYPPGVPLICPGEIITEDMIQYVGGLIRHGVSFEGLEGREGKDSSHGNDDTYGVFPQKAEGQWYINVVDN